MKSAWVIALSALIMIGCGSRSATDPNALLIAYGLQSTTNGISDTDAAITLANLLLSKGVPQLHGTWGDKTMAAGSYVSVFLVADRNLTPGDLAFVTPACEGIVLQSVPFEAWVASLSDSDGPLVEPAAMTAFVLLHELGHLRRGDCGKNLITNQHAELNDQLNADKAQEFAADDVAVNIIKTAMQSGSVDAKVAAGRIEMALGTASFYIAGRRTVASPGAAVIGSPTVFWDIGLSHPNFEWRLLKVNDLLNANETSRQLLADFEAGRLKGEQPLYVAPQPH
jgi:hypothetical protein